jgi:cytochrome c553
MVRLVRNVVALLLPALVLLTACAASAGPGDPGRGEQLFTGAIPIAGGDAPACIGCHPVQPDAEAAVIGPNLSNIGNRAATTVPGQTAEEYLRESIVDGDAFLAGGFQEGIHYRGYDRALSRQDINDLVAYLLTLRSGRD